MSSNSTSEPSREPPPLLVDYHVHPDYSVDAAGSIAQHCRAAIERGLAEICFTTHFDADPAFAAEDGWVRVAGRLTRLSGPWLDAYHADILAARTAFAPAGLKVKMGLEVDYFPGVSEILGGLLDRHPFDFILGSVHRLDGHLLSSAAGAAAWLERYGAEQGLTRYCSRVAEAAASGLFDCMGHLEVYRRSPRVAGQLGPYAASVIEDLLGKVARHGVGIEINTRDARHGSGHTRPGPDVLRMARTQGVTIITTGSDAHAPGEVGEGIETGLAAAREAGFRWVHTFTRRRADPHIVNNPAC